jgi:hypothetical protein
MSSSSPAWCSRNHCCRYGCTRLEQILNCQSISNHALIYFDDGSLSLIVTGHKGRGEKNTGAFEGVCIPLLRQVIGLSVRLRAKPGRGLPLRTIHT